MTADYEAIRRENERKYGTDVGRYGTVLLAEKYDDRTHFIFELLQNAEDALARRHNWRGSRTVSFRLTQATLRVTHSGAPFDDRDVRSICGIAESTKNPTRIGRFGIGFKSVYAFTARPEIHSGDEDFAIEDFVQPVPVDPVEREPEETVFVFPFRPGDADAVQQITNGLKRLGPRTLLFLREIEEIRWSVDGGPSGFYMREELDTISEGIREVAVIGEAGRDDEVDETWLVFSRPVRDPQGSSEGSVEMAFLLERDASTGLDRVRPISRSPLVVFFPTVLETYLGFLLHGPFHTTPSRDNVPHDDLWNQRCVSEAASLLGAAMRWQRDNKRLDADALHCLPFDSREFPDGSMFRALFDETKRLLTDEPLLPRHGGGYIPATKARLARTKDLRDLFDHSQLTELLGSQDEVSWLSGDISQDRTPDLRRYLMGELGVSELTPEAVVSRLSCEFLRSQSDQWIQRLYEFLGGQRSLIDRVKAVPLIRLTDGTHVKAFEQNLPQAFLPSNSESSFPTVRPTVCRSEEAVQFLRALGLTEPNPVDEAIRYVLPKYRADNVVVTPEAYEADIRSLLRAFETDSRTQRGRLVAALREVPFVRAVDAGSYRRCWAKPTDVYLSTGNLTELFAGVQGVLRVDDQHECLRGKAIEEVLVACGALGHLRRKRVTTCFTDQQLREMRIKAGCERTTSPGSIGDYTLDGLEALLDCLPSLPAQDRKERATVLWEALIDLERQQGVNGFSGIYRWTYYGPQMCSFDAAFVRLLNETAWVPDPQGDLRRPEEVLFDSLGWDPSLLLLSKIRFKPPIIEQLAKQAGIEPGVISLLKRLGVTSESDLRARLGLQDGSAVGGHVGVDSIDHSIRRRLGQASGLSPSSHGSDYQTHADDIGPNNRVASALSASARGPVDTDAPGLRGGTTSHDGSQEAAQVRREGLKEDARSGGRRFISYVAVHPHECEPDIDGIDQARRTELEEMAIKHVLSCEPSWLRTREQNSGFDLYQAGPDGRPIRWCEVKAMGGSLADRPVGLSRAQFEYAEERGDDYWLYIVEHAGDENRARLVRIQNPAGRARTFLFDHGWLEVASGLADPWEQEQ